jgi:hypothetical protein
VIHWRHIKRWLCIWSNGTNLAFSWMIGTYSFSTHYEINISFFLSSYVSFVYTCLPIYLSIYLFWTIPTLGIGIP